VALTRCFLFLVFILPVFAQNSSTTQSIPDPAQQTEAKPSQTQQDEAGADYVFKVNVVERSAKAVNYRHRGGATKINFAGTELMPKARGEAKVESKQGYIEIEVEFDNLVKPEKFGAEYMTYVMWAITPEGRSVNLGEVLLNGTRSKLDVTTDLQVFGLIITAEPYFAVTQPSNLVVMENVIRPDTRGRVEAIEARYELLERGGYTKNLTDIEPVIVSYDLPLELYEARNAVRIARMAKADKYAVASFERASGSLKQAEQMATAKKIDKKTLIMNARQAVQTAEDARAISLRRQDEERLADERAAAAEREAKARAETEAETRARQQAESERETAERLRLEQIAAADKARTEAEARQRALNEEAERQRQAAAASEQARLKAEQEKEALRARLLQQLNTILETRDTERGLVVNMSDVLFDSGKHTLRPLAREKLAKISGIVLAYPGLKLQAEGHTDSVGSDAFNQKLSEKRAASVQDYLVNQSVPADAITSVGLGKNDPVADNKTAKGRQQNRRVELIVSGEVIGSKIGPVQDAPGNINETSASPAAPQAPVERSPR
jgi:outer membrane protein OmpA-like peptidoglycan-associated protein